MDSYLAIKISSFCVANLRNSQLLRAIRALNLNILITIYFAQNKSEVPYNNSSVTACRENTVSISY